MIRMEQGGGRAGEQPGGRADVAGPSGVFTSHEAVRTLVFSTVMLCEPPSVEVIVVVPQCVAVIAASLNPPRSRSNGEC